MAASASRSAQTLRTLFFDLGGVVYSTPFKAIEAFEARHNLRHDLINDVIKAHGREGNFGKLEEGKITLTEFDVSLCFDENDAFSFSQA